MKPQFLKGVRFTDLTWAGAGPFCTKIFSDFGADVLKIESTTRPDSVRMGGPFKDRIPGTNRSGYFASRNTGKKSMSLDLKHPAALDLVHAMIRESDVVSNNFGPGAMDRLGLDYASLCKIKPDIIALSMPMYGSAGPRAKLLGVGMTISAATGIMWHTAYASGDAVGPGTHYPDHAANPYHAAFAVIAALRQRRRTGVGMEIDLSQVESTANFMGPALVEAALTGHEPPQIGNRSRLHAPHNVFGASGDDEWVAIAVTDDAQWRSLCGAMERRDLAADARLARADGRLEHLDVVENAVAAWAGSRTAHAIVEALVQVGVPAAKVQSSRDLIEGDAHLRANGAWQRVDHPEVGSILLNSPPFKIDGERVDLERPPLLGEHTHELLSGFLGIAKERIAELEAQGALS